MTAFVTGFANQANENIERQKMEDRENDLIWANKFEKGKAEYEKERKDASEKSKFYKTLLTTFEGDAKAADLAFQMAGQNPKRAMEAVAWVSQNKASGRITPDPAYQSNSLGDIQANLSNRYQNLEELKGSARQGSLFRSGNTYADKMQMPMAPGGGMPNTLQQPNPGSFQPPSSTPMPATSNTPIGVSTPTKFPNDSAGDLPASGPRISLDTEAPPGYPTDQVVPSPGQTTPSLPLPQQAQAGQGGYKPLTPYMSPETKRQADQTRIAEETLEFNKQVHKDTMARKPESFTQQQNVLTGNKIALDFFTDAKTGLQAQAKQLHESQALRYDINGMMSALEKGILAKSGQEVIDNINKFTLPYLGLDLSDPRVGIANSTSDANLMRKYVANALIDRLKTMHFGRITNYTEQLTLKGMPSTENDPDTNVRIVLAIQDTLKSALELNKLVQNYAHSPENLQALNEGKKSWYQIYIESQQLATKYNDEYAKKAEPFPMVDKLSPVSQLEVGTWFEYKHDKRMYKFLGIDQQGNMLLQNAGGKDGSLPKTGPVPRSVWEAN